MMTQGVRGSGEISAVFDLMIRLEKFLSKLKV